jgi:hypothetical protein
LKQAAHRTYVRYHSRHRQSTRPLFATAAT